jgi:uncharacterized protein with FMN-binding domain
MKKYFQIIVVLSIFSIFVYVHNHREEESKTPAVTDIRRNTVSNSGNSTPTPSSSSEPIPAVGQYKDGTYTGSVADAFYGLIQVQAVISGGRIADVVFLQSPNDNRTSREINSQAMIILKEEAIQAQNAQVDIVSGASQSSQAFRVSLADALSKAK